MDLSALLSAIASKQWVVAGALIVGALVAAAKQGWLSTWLAHHLPPAVLPYLAVSLGALGLASAEVLAGKPLAQALLDGVSSGILAVFGHEVCIESLRGGKELKPCRLPPKESP